MRKFEKKFKAKSVTISRKPAESSSESWSAFIGIFDENNPHLHGRVPIKVLDVPKIEKVRIRELKNISYYLQGNDIVINNLEEVVILKEDSILTITGKQILPH